MQANKQDVNEAKMWRAFRAGNEKAFLELFDAFYPSMSSYGYRLCQHVQMTDDAIQEVFLELWVKRLSVVRVERIKPYLFKILKRKLMKALQREKMSISDTSFQDRLKVPSIEQEIMDSEEEKRSLKQLEEALETLPPRQREILYLRFYEGLSYEEIADMAEIKVNRVYNLVYEAIKRLRSMLHQ